MANSYSGYKFGFLNEPDDSLKCLICLGLAEEPWQHSECGKLFCGECLKKHKSRKNTGCPNCRKKEPQYFKDNRGTLLQIFFSIYDVLLSLVV